MDKLIIKIMETVDPLVKALMVHMIEDSGEMFTEWLEYWASNPDGSLEDSYTYLSPKQALEIGKVIGAQWSSINADNAEQIKTERLIVMQIIRVIISIGVSALVASVNDDQPQIDNRETIPGSGGTRNLT